MASSTKLSTKGQIIIPKHIREKLGLKEGDHFLVYIMDNDTILLRRKKEKISLKDLRGLLSNKVDLEKATKFIAKLREEWST